MTVDKCSQCGTIENVKDEFCPSCSRQFDKDVLADIGWDEGGLDDAEMECGMTSSGLCTLAGTEHCDWDCPYNPCDAEGL